MSKKALYGIAMVLLLPLIAYFLLKKYTDRDAVPPRHYLPDSTITVTKNGKQYVDTLWHKVADFHLTNHLGKQVSWKDFEDKVVVVNFFFTHCPTICPTLMLNTKSVQDAMKRVQRGEKKASNLIQFVSLTIDPERDSVEQLKRWADRFQIDPQNWWLLTGNKKDIYDLSIKEMRVPAEDGGLVDSNFIHTDVFVLIDRNRNIRGYYHTIDNKPEGGFTADTASLSKLSRDIIFLALEKDPNRKFFLSAKLPLIAIVFAVAAILIVLLMFFIKKEK